ncbi:hypothetical protein DFQ29_006557, partial [Apophysomyces sp. BC1021]
MGAACYLHQQVQINTSVLQSLFVIPLGVICRYLYTSLHLSKKRKKSTEAEDDDFQQPIAVRRPTRSGTSGVKPNKGKEKAVISQDGSTQSEYTVPIKDIEDIFKPGPSSTKKSKSLIKAEKAYDKRSLKYEARATVQQEQTKAKLSAGKTLRCPSCGETDHQRSTSKLCGKRTPKRKPPKEFKRTRVIKASLSNTCR